MPALLDMSLFPLPDAVEELSFEALRVAWLADYARRMGVTVEQLNDNDPAVKVLETSAYREMLVRQRINDSVRRTMLASSFGEGLDDLGRDPLYNLERRVIQPADFTVFPPKPAVYEDDDTYRPRLAQAPNALSPAGPAGAYRALALAAHPGVVDVAVSSPRPSEVLVEVLFDETLDSNDDLLDRVEEALSADAQRPVGDRVSVVAAQHIRSAVRLRVIVNDGPDLEVVRKAAQERVDAIVLPVAARVRSGQALVAGESRLWRGAAMVPGAIGIEEVDATGMENPNAAWWPMSIVVEVRRYSDAS